MLKIRNKHLAAALAAISLALGIGFVAEPVSATPTPTVTVACTRAIIGGQPKCIAAGQFCARRFQSDYRRYGYSCSKKDRNGRYHLKKL